MAEHDDHSDVAHDADLLPDLQVLAEDLRLAYVRDPEPEVVARHVAAMVAAVGAPVVPLRAQRRRRAAAAGAVACAGIILTGGLAAAGVLPAALQDGVAKLMHPIGIDVQHSGDHDRSDDQVDQPGDDQPESDQGRTDPVGVVENSTTTTTEAGQDGTPGATAPGQTGELPAPATTAPGHDGTGPGRSETAPGLTGAGGNNKPAVPPGQVDNPGQGKGTAKSPTTTTTTLG